MQLKSSKYSSPKLWANSNPVCIYITTLDSSKGGFKSEDTGEFFHCQHKYSKSLSSAENLNKLFTVLGRKFKFSAQNSDLEYLCWQWKNSPVSSDLKPPLGINA